MENDEALPSSGERFTKADWRPGKNHPRRKRLRNWGGQKVAPAAFIAGRDKFNAEGGVLKLPRCKHCKMIAMKGLSVCGIHGGMSILARQGMHIKQRDRAEWLEARRQKALLASLEAPPELQGLALYQGASQQTRIRLIAAWQTSAWPKAVSEAKRMSGPAD